MQVLGVKPEIMQEVYLERLQNPLVSQKQIGVNLNLSESTVSRALKKQLGSHDFKLGQMLSGKFLEEFQMASDYWKMQISRFEELKKKDENGFPTIEFEKELELMKQQSQLWEKILFLARQGEAVEVMRLMKNGAIQLPATN